MKRLKLLAAMLALGAVLAAAVLMGSSYAPVMERMKPIEEIWALEDTREESSEPLVTALEMDGQALAYDAQTARSTARWGWNRARHGRACT